MSTIKERVEQLEKDVQDIAVTLRDLLMWKRNMKLGLLPETQKEKGK